MTAWNKPSTANPIFNIVCQCCKQLTERGWCERLVDIAPDEDAAHLRYVLSPGATPASRLLVERRLAALPPTDADGAAFLPGRSLRGNRAPLHSCRFVCNNVAACSHG